MHSAVKLVCLEPNLYFSSGLNPLDLFLFFWSKNIINILDIKEPTYKEKS